MTSEFGRSLGATAKYWQVRPSVLIMIKRYPDNLFFDMTLAGEMIRLETEASDEARSKTGQSKARDKHLLGDTRRDRPEIQRQLDIFADRPIPKMSTKKVMPVKKGQFEKMDQRRKR
ncbi:hypothetical protein LCGC14_0267170 [marine sediment metagenome]|uniref:Uncharacterized protein n=1 Tax=marine sediment metagenome TaxID=412755 RepID=A0A0F9WKK1_9ZZZZ